MEREDFEQLIIKILDSVPENFKQRLENIDIVIDEESIKPSAREKSQKSRITLALYHGVPLTERRGKSHFPDKITVFKKAVESISKNPIDIEKNLRRVILHELGHYFGLDEGRLKELGY